MGILAAVAAMILVAGTALAISTMSPKITYTGYGSPDNETGREGDLYVDLDTSVLWVFRNSSWQMFAIFPVVVNGTEGPIGPTGPQGSQGEQGPMGPQGPQGEQGPAGINGVNGTNGVDGKDGVNGTDGRDGVDGNTWFHGNTVPDPVLGRDGDLYLDYATWDVYAKESGSWVVLGNIKGMQGEPGIQGETGPQGTAGPTGPAGPQGEIGPVGPVGKDGVNGTNGLDGKDGFNGLNGIDGANGIDGTDGTHALEIPWWIVAILSVASGSAVLTSVYAVSKKNGKKTRN